MSHPTPQSSRLPAAARPRASRNFVVALRQALALPAEAGDEFDSFVLQDGVEVLATHAPGECPRLAFDFGPVLMLDNAAWLAFMRVAAGQAHRGRVMVVSEHLWLSWRGDEAQPLDTQVEDALEVLAVAAEAAEALKHAAG